MALTRLHDFILYCIEVHGAFSYPELGTLTTERLPAKYAFDRKHILPPEIKLNFKPTYESKYDLKYLAKLSDIEEVITKHWISILQNFVSSKNTEHEVSLDITGLGTIKHSDNGIQFIPLENIQNNESGSLYPIISIQPLPLPVHNIEFAVENPKKLVIPGKEKQSLSGKLIFPIMIIAIVSLVLSMRSCLYISGDGKEIPLNTQITSNENTLLNDTAQEIATGIFDTTAVDSIHLKSPLENPIDSSVNEPQPQTKPEANIIQRDSACIFVVGAFLKKNNAVLLKKKLKKEALDVEIYPFGKFFRVGITLSCKTDTSIQYKNLHSRFPDIWLLE